MSCAVRNVRPYMEDRHNIRRNLVPGAHLVAVYDGHGGDEVSALCALHFPECLRRRLRQSLDGGKKKSITQTDGARCMTGAIEDVDAICKATTGLVSLQVGSTLCAALVLEAQRKLVVANVGDSRMVLVEDSKRKARQLTVDHGASCPLERKRISGLGGILKDAFGTDRVMGVLNLTRSLGDWYMRPFVPSAPAVTTFPYEIGDAVIVASDGLWDVVGSAELVHLISKKRKEDGTAAFALVKEAMYRGSTDNVTVVISIF